MKELAINRFLDDETRKQGAFCGGERPLVAAECKQGIVIGGKVYSLHIPDDGHNEAIITDNNDYTKIYCIQSLDFFNEWF